MTRAWRWLAVAFMAALVMGCDPCAGVPSCRTDARLSYSGRIIEYASGRGAAGVTLVFRHFRGAASSVDSLVAVTDEDGRFQIAVALQSAGEATADVEVRPRAPLPSYVVPNVRMETAGVRGGGGVFDTWTVRPYVAWIASVRGRAGVDPSWVYVLFERTGGARLAGGDTLDASADADGNFFMRALALDTGVVRGTLTLRSTNFAREYVVRGVAIPVRVVDRVPALDRVLVLGSSLSYAVELRVRGTDAPLAGADVEFRRTGGIPLLRDTILGRTNADGRVTFSAEPASEQPGEVVGEIVVRGVGAARSRVVTGVRFQSFDSDELRFGGVYNVGYAAQAAGEIVRRGDGVRLTDADVQFVRTGGVQTTPATATVRPNAEGLFAVRLSADTTGEVVGDLIVRRPGVTAPTTFSGVRFAVRGDDSLRYAGVFSVGQRLAYAGILRLQPTGAPATGWTVLFRRTGGIRLASDTLRSTVLDWGGFGLSPLTQEEGSVQGELTARSPDGTREVPLGPVTIQTFDGEEVRLAGTWHVGPALPSVGDVHVFAPAPRRDPGVRGVRPPTFETDELRPRGTRRPAGPR